MINRSGGRVQSTIFTLVSGVRHDWIPVLSMRTIVALPGTP